MVLTVIRFITDGKDGEYLLKKRTMKMRVPWVTLLLLIMALPAMASVFGKDVDYHAADGTVLRGSLASTTASGIRSPACW